MGGKSTGTFVVNESEKVGVFHGSVEIVSFLNAPGFIKAETTKGESWPDVSSCEGLQFALRSSTPSYEGFRVSFGNKRPPDAFPYSYGFKANMKLDAGDASAFQTVQLPFDQFTDKWDAGTGDAIVTCAENKEYCPDEASLKSLFSVAVWGEGVEGEADLEIKSVAAYGCKGTSSSSSVGSESESSHSTESEETFKGIPEETASDGDIISIEDFSNPIHEWRTMNDPVMGGQSTSSVSVGDGIATFEGTCAIVPFLKAPGFITMTTGDHPRPGGGSSSSSIASSFPDVSNCQGLTINTRTTVDYKGYYVSFGTDKAPGSRYSMGYKTHLDLAASDNFGDVMIPFSAFSSKWDDATGETKITCKEDPKYCPSMDNLQDMKTISFWGEGVEGDVDLEIKSVAAYGCKSSSSVGSDIDAIIESNEPEEIPHETTSDTIRIEDFSNPLREWRTMNDPVMGGKSTSSVSVGEGMASFEGTCAIVPFLRAPGFITMTSGTHTPPRVFGHSNKSTSSSTNAVSFPNVSSCQGLTVTLRSSVDYEGYYVSFGTDKVNGGHHASGYKTHLDLAASDNFGDVMLPFSDFSSRWDDATGKTKVTCQEDPKYCPSLDNLQDMKTISFWGEGVEGTVALDVKYIGAYGCASGGASFLASASLSGGTATNGSSSSSYWSVSPLPLCAVVAVAVASVVITAGKRRRSKIAAQYEEVDVTESDLV
jgi:hypothetical protein